MKFKNILFIALILMVTSVCAKNNKTVQPGEISKEGKSELNIVSYGAVGDGKTLNTETIQKAIDEKT